MKRLHLHINGCIYIFVLSCFFTTAKILFLLQTHEPHVLKLPANHSFHSTKCFPWNKPDYERNLISISKNERCSIIKLFDSLVVDLDNTFCFFMTISNTWSPFGIKCPHFLLLPSFIFFFILSLPPLLQLWTFNNLQTNPVCILSGFCCILRFYYTSWCHDVVFMGNVGLGRG